MANKEIPSPDWCSQNCNYFCINSISVAEWQGCCRTGDVCAHERGHRWTWLHIQPDSTLGNCCYIHEHIEECDPSVAEYHHQAPGNIVSSQVKVGNISPGINYPSSPDKSTNLLWQWFKPHNWTRERINFGWKLSMRYTSLRWKWDHGKMKYISQWASLRMPDGNSTWTCHSIFLQLRQIVYRIQSTWHGSPGNWRYILGKKDTLWLL